MLSAVDLDDQPCRLAYEVSNIATDRLLLSPLSTETTRAQLDPQAPLSIGRVPPQALCAR
jgi:hypothetical protein